MAHDPCRPKAGHYTTWLTPLLVLLGCVGIYSATASINLIHDDARSASFAAWRIAETGEPWVDGVDLRDFGFQNDSLAFVGQNPEGHRVIYRSPGVVAIGIPAYAAAGTGEGADEFSMRPGNLMAALLAALTCLLLYVTLRSRMRERHALLTTGVFAFATPMWSVVGNTLWTHSVTTLGITGMAWAASRERWWLVGLFGGVALWGRLHTALIVAVLGLGIALARRRPRIAVAIGATSAASMGLASLWTHWMYGTWFPSGGYSDAYLKNAASGVGDSAVDKIVNHLGLWISPDRGILIWTPLLILLLPAVIRAWHDLPDWARWLPTGGILYTLIQGQLNLFTGGDGYYGYRLGTEMLVCAAPAYALAARRMGKVARQIVGPLIGLQLAAILLGAISESFLVLRENAWTDNSLWLAMRTVPLVNIWLVLMIIVGWLAGRVWQDRGWGAAPLSSPARTG